jgi:hypothetical protein
MCQLEADEGESINRQWQGIGAPAQHTNQFSFDDVS